MDIPEPRPFRSLLALADVPGSLHRDMPFATRLWHQVSLSKGPESTVKIVTSNRYLLCSPGIGARMLEEFLQAESFEKVAKWIGSWGLPANCTDFDHIFRCAETIRCLDELQDSVRHADSVALHKYLVLEIEGEQRYSVQWKFTSGIDLEGIPANALARAQYITENDVWELAFVQCPSFSFQMSKEQKEDDVILIAGRVLIAGLYTWLLEGVSLRVTPSTEPNDGTQLVLQYDIQCPFHLMILEQLLRLGVWPPRNCRACGALFSSKKSTAVYCNTEACKKAKQRKKRRAKQDKESV